MEIYYFLLGVWGVGMLITPLVLVIYFNQRSRKCVKEVVGE